MRNIYVLTNNYTPGKGYRRHRGRPCQRFQQRNRTYLPLFNTQWLHCRWETDVSKSEPDISGEDYKHWWQGQHQSSSRPSGMAIKFSSDYSTGWRAETREERTWAQYWDGQARGFHYWRFSSVNCWSYSWGCGHFSSPGCCGCWNCGGMPQKEARYHEKVDRSFPSFVHCHCKGHILGQKNFMRYWLVNLG